MKKVSSITLIGDTSTYKIVSLFGRFVNQKYILQLLIQGFCNKNIVFFQIDVQNRAQLTSISVIDGKLNGIINIY